MILGISQHKLERSYTKINQLWVPAFLQFDSYPYEKGRFRSLPNCTLRPLQSFRLYRSKKVLPWSSSDMMGSPRQSRCGCRTRGPAAVHLPCCQATWKKVHWIFAWFCIVSVFFVLHFFHTITWLPTRRQTKYLSISLKLPDIQWLCFKCDNHKAQPSTNRPS